MPPILISASVLTGSRASPELGTRRSTGLLLNPHYATPPALTAVATNTMFRVVSFTEADGRRHVHAEPLIPAGRHSCWKPAGNRLHSDDPAFAEFTGGTEPIPLYDEQAA